MKALYNLKEMLCAELEEIADKGELSAGDLETAEKLTSTIKNIHKIIMYEDEGYSRAGDWIASGNYGRMYERGNSYGKRTMRDRYSRAEGTEMLADRIKEMMNEDGISGKERTALKQAWDTISGMK